MAFHFKYHFKYLFRNIFSSSLIKLLTVLSAHGLDGILKTEVGYCGGNSKKTSYKEACTGNTNHAEVVKVEYDESVITYEQILNIFFENHNPTQLNRQGPDVGTQYRSSIYYLYDNQKSQAEQKIYSLQQNFNNNIVTHTHANTVIQAKKEYAHTIIYTKQALKQNPGYAPGHYNLAKALHMTGNPEKAMSSYRSAVKYNPYFEEAFFNLGFLALEQKKFMESVSNF